MSTAPGPAAGQRPLEAYMSAWLAESAGSAACGTLCAAPGITAKTEYACLLTTAIHLEGKSRKASLKTSVMTTAPWTVPEEPPWLRKYITAKDKKARSACDHQTAPRGCAVQDTSGPRFVNLSSKKVRCVPSTGGKAPTGWRYSSAVTVGKGWPAGCRETITKPAILPGSTPVRDTKPVGLMGRTPLPNICYEKSFMICQLKPKDVRIFSV